MPGYAKYYHPQCKVCNSPNRLEYERLRLEEGKTFPHIIKIAKEKGEEFNEANFSRHFSSHTALAKTKKEAALDSSYRSKKLVEKKLTETLSVIDSLIKNTNTLQEKMNLISREEPSTKMIYAIVKLQDSIRQNLETLSRLKQQLRIEPSGQEDKERERLFKAIKRLDPKLALILLDELEKVEEEENEEL